MFRTYSVCTFASMKTKEVVINVCHGGFGLSALAVSEIAKRKGLTAYFFKSNYNGDNTVYEPISIPKANEGGVFTAFSVPNPNDYELNKKAGENDYKESNERYEKIALNYDSSDFSREDKDLIAVVKELGESANGKYAKLKVVEIPTDVEYEISEYDGFEGVAEKHRTWG